MLAARVDSAALQLPRLTLTAIALTAALTTLHRTMPNMMLEPDERADIIAYILSLK
jgi:hypothetical protein